MARCVSPYFVIVFVIGALVNYFVAMDFGFFVADEVLEDRQRRDVMSGPVRAVSPTTSTTTKPTTTTTTTTMTPIMRTPRYGKMVRGMKHVIIMNDVPRTASRLLYRASRGAFDYNWTTVPDHLVRIELEEKNIEDVQKLKPPALVHGHTSFFPYATWKNPPIYINFVREPVARMESQFYYERFGDYAQDPSVHQNDNMTLEQCVEKGLVWCVPWWNWHELFCGYESRCQTDNDWSLQEAKANIDQFYTFVGITEEFETSLQIIELLVPDLLGGLVKAYKELNDDGTNWNELFRTRNKTRLSPELVDTAREIMNDDVELYEHAYNKFRRLKTRFGLD